MRKLIFIFLFFSYSINLLSVEAVELVVTKHALTRKECFQYFRKKELYKLYQPYLIHIDNQSEHLYQLLPDRIDPQIVEAEKVFKRLAQFPKLQGLLAGGAVLAITWPLALVVTGVGAVTGGAVGTTVIGLLASPVVVGGVVWHSSGKSNQKLKRSTHQKAIKDKVIRPTRSYDCIIFIPRENLGELKISFEDLQTGEIISL